MLEDAERLWAIVRLIIQGVPDIEIAHQFHTDAGRIYSIVKRGADRRRCNGRVGLVRDYLRRHSGLPVITAYSKQYQNARRQFTSDEEHLVRAYLCNDPDITYRGLHAQLDTSEVAVGRLWRSVAKKLNANSVTHAQIICICDNLR